MEDDKTVTVNVEEGKLLGHIGTDVFGGQFYKFHGIPYAKPPTGNLRFKAPEPPIPWKGIRDATTELEGCFSRSLITKNLIGSEDCLYLNVYTKKLPHEHEALLPVLVWIHGGAFVWGSSNTNLYGPDFLLTEDIVLVTVTFRLGILGFLSLEDESLGVPGNAGLKDQNLALRWIQRNIIHFNGDPNNVTLFGESSGATCVHYHVLSQKSKGLFHKAIMQSGCALSVWSQGSHIAREIVKVMGYNDITSEKAALEILKQVPVEKIHYAVEALDGFFFANTKRPFGPVIEKDSEEAFITRQPIEIILSGEYNTVPMIFGYTSKEGMILEFYKKLYTNLCQSFDFESFVPWMMRVKETEKSKSIATKIENEYFKQADNIENLWQALSDSIFVVWIFASVKNHRVSSPYPIFLFKMTVDSSLNFIKPRLNISNSPGACHADDLGYLFHNFYTPAIKSGSLEELSLKRFVKLWTNFAKYGNPTPKNTNLQFTWNSVASADEICALDIGNDLNMLCNIESKMLSLWGDILKESPVTEKYL